MDVQSGDKSGSLSGKLVGEPCPAKVEPAKPAGHFDHTPGWLAWLSALTGVGWFYFLAAVVLFAFSWLLRRNANSLHRLYRDRISKAFLFNPQRRIRDDGVAQSRDFVPLDPFRLTALSSVDAPYHLINATLNIQGSDFANRRGRNADFFLFSCRLCRQHRDRLCADREAGSGRRRPRPRHGRRGLGLRPPRPTWARCRSVR